MIIARGTTPNSFNDHFDILSSQASLTDDGQLAFAGLESADEFFENPFDDGWEVHLSSSLVDSRDVVSNLPLGGSEVTTLEPGSFFRFDAADGDRVVVASRRSGDATIRVFDTTGVITSDTIASTSGGWNSLGVRIGFSDDGSAVAFAGDLGASGASAINAAQPDWAPIYPGPGVFVAIESGGEWGIRRVAGAGVLDPNETYTDVDMNGAFTPGVDTESGGVAIDVEARLGVARRAIASNHAAMPVRMA